MDQIHVGNRSMPFAEAHEYVADYLSAADHGWSYPAYDGYMYDDAAGPLTDADLLAPVLLNVAHLSVATFYRLQRARPGLQKMLDELSPGLQLLDATAADLKNIGLLFQDVGTSALKGAGATMLSKILHRKRPALIPLQDAQVRRCYQEGTDAPIPLELGRTWAQFTNVLVERIKEDLRDQYSAFVQLSELAKDVPVTPLRAFDIVAWRLGRPAGRASSPAK